MHNLTQYFFSRHGLVLLSEDDGRCSAQFVSGRDAIDGALARFLPHDAETVACVRRALADFHEFPLAGTAFAVPAGYVGALASILVENCTKGTAVFRAVSSLPPNPPWCGLIISRGTNPVGFLAGVVSGRESTVVGVTSKERVQSVLRQRGWDRCRQASAVLAVARRSQLPDIAPDEPFEVVGPFAEDLIASIGIRLAERRSRS